MQLLLQTSPIFFTVLADILGLTVGSVGPNVTSKRVSLHRNHLYD